MYTQQEAYQQEAYRYPAETIATSLQSDIQSGLTTQRALEARKIYGPNQLPAATPPPAWRKFLEQFINPLTILLLVATLISALIWLLERDTPVPFEALTILSIVLLNGVLGYLQQHRAEQAMAALQTMTTETARVVRNSALTVVPSADVVPGDLLLLEEGDILTADARVLEATALQVVEAALTGESMAVSKETIPLTSELGLADQTNMVFAGTTVTSGRGRAIVIHTGVQTEIGKIASSLQQVTEPPTPLQRELDRLGKQLGLIVLLIACIMSIVIFIVTPIRTLSQFIDILLLVVSLAVAAVPEGLTAVTNIVLALGTQRMARQNVIIRKLPAIETLGATTVICTDKTGTLTRNEMTVRTLLTASGRVDVTGTGYRPEGSLLLQEQPLADPQIFAEAQQVLQCACLANNATLYEHDGTWLIDGDPTEGALLTAARKGGWNEVELRQTFPRIGEHPFTSERKRMSTIHKGVERKNGLLVCVKGAPDLLLARCTHELNGTREIPLTTARRTAILKGIDILAHEALRTLGVAHKRRTWSTLPLTEEEAEQELVWLGIIGLMDPPRLEARDAVYTAQQARVRVVMITGDHPITATAIATELGIMRSRDMVLTGTDLEHTSDEQLRMLVNETAVYARVAPQHKLRIVEALKANGEVAAMTGDGVNDAPALKTADIGIAMGRSGTNVSRAVADMLLVDDNFASIVTAIKEGRIIFANLQKFLRYLLSSNIGEIMTMFFGVLLAELLGLVTQDGMGAAVPLLATQILWINLLTDTGPALALGLDPGEANYMHNPPRSTRQSITSELWPDMLLVGSIMTLGTLFVIDLALPAGVIPGYNTLTYARTMGFTTLVFFQLWNVFNAHVQGKHWRRHLFTNRWLWGSILLSLLLQIAVVYIPLLQLAFSTVALSLPDWLLCLGVSSSVLWGRQLVYLLLPHKR